MKIINEKDKDNIKQFKDLDVGDTFKVCKSSHHSDDIYLKTEYVYVEWKPRSIEEYVYCPYNAFCLTTNKRYNFSPNTPVISIECELLVKKEE